MKRQVRTPVHCYINALGSSPHDEYPKETEIGEDKTLGLNTYDKITFINVMVSEVKESENSAIEAQNNEQMLGLWKGSQQAMLGLEVYGHCVRPKVLSLNGV